MENLTMGKSAKINCGNIFVKILTSEKSVIILTIEISVTILTIGIYLLYASHSTPYRLCHRLTIASPIDPTTDFML